MRGLIINGVPGAVAVEVVPPVAVEVVPLEEQLRWPVPEDLVSKWPWEQEGQPGVQCKGCVYGKECLIILYGLISISITIRPSFLQWICCLSGRRVSSTETCPRATTLRAGETAKEKKMK